jgi:glutamate racemase
MASGATLGSERDYGHLPFVVGPKLVPGPAPKPFERRDQTKPLPGPRMIPRTLENPTILVFDSGLGGLTVYREVARARPDARYVYAADDALFPYGAIEEDRLIARAVDLMERLIADHRPDLVVIACNTASTIVLPSLRARLAVPFVGTVPAIKPACAASKSKRVSVLGTEATVKREYTRALIREFAADCQVTLVGSARLASLAEAALAGEAVEDAAIAAEIAPCFVDDGAARTDTVVLACTHYPLLAERLTRLSPWPVNFIDPAPAIARRVVDLIGPVRNGHAPAAPEVVFSSGRTPPAAVWAVLDPIGRAPSADLGENLQPPR